MVYHNIAIPSNQEFLTSWHRWIHSRVSKHFKRNKSRIMDTAQKVRLRLLSKDAVGRWFYKHLVDEMTDRTECVRMLGGVEFYKSNSISPMIGDRNDPNSLWMIRDILDYANFDYDRYYYSIQGHTINSTKVLRLLGYSDGKFGVLESLYRQGRLRPAELTEHECIEKLDARKAVNGLCAVQGCGEKHLSRGFCSKHYRSERKSPCIACKEGRESLATRGLSLGHRWEDASSWSEAARLRWNDSQLAPFLRDWRKTNMIKALPRHIVRAENMGIEAGLLKYMDILITNAVVNEFKSLTRTDDLPFLKLERKCPEFEDTYSIGKESTEDSDGADGWSIVVCDPQSERRTRAYEVHHDLMALLSSPVLTTEERDAITKLDIDEEPISTYCERMGLTTIRVNKIRSAGFEKLRSLARNRSQSVA